MPKDFSRLTIAVPSFDDAELFLKKCGTIVANEIVAMINREEQPDGAQQKQNSPRYADAKQKKMGYRTPLKGMGDNPKSPYLARPSTFLRTMVYEFGAHGAMDRALLIHLNQRRAEIGKKLTARGYWFMGINKQAEVKIIESTRRYWKNKMAQMKRAL
jgi:hypothetical protein